MFSNFKNSLKSYANVISILYTYNTSMCCKRSSGVRENPSANFSIPVHSDPSFDYTNIYPC
ncbi:MAG: hypothetical protein C4527_23610 [Candidatus Omnitrophota bacterium]|nr:MAG: hypothetical protein C4527_23610 [Candidatus Omnitrophota bacterium]